MLIDKKKLRTPILLLVFGILFSVFSAIVSVGATENWFSRSGAVLSFVAVVVQFMLGNVKKEEIENLLKSNIGLKEKLKTIRVKDTKHEIVSAISGITGLVGTLIWGYGDLLY